MHMDSHSCDGLDDGSGCRYGVRLAAEAIPAFVLCIDTLAMPIWTGISCHDFFERGCIPRLFFFYVQLPFFLTEKMSVHIQLMVVSIPVCKGNLLIIYVKVVIRVNQDVRG